MTKRVLVTGATGFTGRYLAPQLAAAGYEVHGTCLDWDGAPPAGISKLHRVDIADYSEVANVVAEVKPALVAHLAAISYVAHSDAAEMYRSNILGTRNLLEALAASPENLRAVLLASSANIYGNSCEGALDEDVPPAPANDYGVTKAASELVASLYRERLPLIVVRPFNYTGRGQSEKFLIPKIVSHVRRGEPEIELGNLDVARDFSDVRGVVDVYMRLLAAPSAIGGTFNVCSGRATSLRDVVEMVQQISGHELAVRVNPAFVRANDVRMLWGSAAKLERVIGPVNMPAIEDTLRWMVTE